MTKDRSVWQRLVAMLLCLVFVCAFYGSLTVQAVFGVDDIVIGGTLVACAAALTYITVVGLSGSDLAEPLYDAANRANTNINNWLEPKIETFLRATDGTTLLETQIDSLVNGLSYGKNGILYFSDALGSFIHDFGEWLIDNGDISLDTSDSSVLQSYTPKNNNWTLSNASAFNFPLIFTGREVYYYQGSANYTYRVIASGGTTVYSFICKPNGQWVSNPIFVGNANFTITVIDPSGKNYVYSPTSYSLDGKTYYYWGGRNTSNFVYPDNVVQNLNTSVIDTYVLQDIVKLAFNQEFSSTGATDGLDVWNQDAPAGFAVDPSSVIGGSIGAADVPAGAIAGIGDYVQAIADAIAGIADISLPVAGVGDIAIDPAIPADIAIPVTPAIPADRADSVPATGEATPAYPATGDYTLPLADFFPFCIPFDIYKMLSLLSAAPEAPAFTWQFYAPGGETIPIEVDLSQFNTVASVLRAVETLAFCVGLGFVTKKLLFGS